MLDALRRVFFYTGDAGSIPRMFGINHANTLEMPKLFLHSILLILGACPVLSEVITLKWGNDQCFQELVSPLQLRSHFFEVGRKRYSILPRCWILLFTVSTSFCGRFSDRAGRIRLHSEFNIILSADTFFNSKRKLSVSQETTINSLRERRSFVVPKVEKCGC